MVACFHSYHCQMFVFTCRAILPGAMLVLSVDVLLVVSKVLLLDDKVGLVFSLVGKEVAMSAEKGPHIKLLHN